MFKGLTSTVPNFSKEVNGRRISVEGTVGVSETNLTREDRGPMGDWIKRKEREKAAQMALYHAVVSANVGGYHQVASDQAAFGSGLLNFVDSMDAVDAAREMLRSKVEAKDLAEAFITELFRSQVGKIQ